MWAWTRRSSEAELREWFDEAVISGDIAICDLVRLELLHSTRTPTEFAEVREELDALPDCPIGNTEWKRALWVHERLAATSAMGQRSVKHPDLLIAAAAELAGMTLVHYDSDYDLIAAVTGQPARWLAPRGSLG